MENTQEQVKKAPFLSAVQAVQILKDMRGEYLNRDDVAKLRVNGREPTAAELQYASCTLAYLHTIGVVRRRRVETSKHRMFAYTYKKGMPKSAKKVEGAPKRKNNVSAEGRQRISECVKAYWAKRRAQQANFAKPTAHAVRTIMLPANTTEIITPHATIYVVPKAGV
jgi:hypothetical protein